MPRTKGVRNTPKEIIAEIIEKHRSGATRKALAEEYGKAFKTIKAMIWRENRKACGVTNGQPQKTRGRKAAVTLQEYKYENKRLRMENELLRDFLYLAGRR